MKKRDTRMYRVDYKGPDGDHRIEHFKEPRQAEHEARKAKDRGEQVTIKQHEVDMKK